METLTKTCTKCLRELPLEQYGKQSANPDGLKYECRECARRYLAEWRAANADRIREHTKQYKANMTPEQLQIKNQRDRDRYHASPKAFRDTILRKKYGITLAEYDAMLATQDGRCAICGDEAGERTLHVDHHHDTGAVRGLLCARCNTGLGQFRDSPEFLTQAIAYLLNT